MSPVRFRLASLQKRHITIVLVGETGVGKTSFMSLLANYCAGRGPADGFDLAHDPTNESNLPLNQSQTNSALLYKIPGPDGLIIRILDTPGLADTRGLEQDELHKAGIVASIRNQVNAIDAVIVMANGTVERLGIATDYALETIAAMFPRSIAENIGFLFTNVADILSFNFQTDSLPEAVRDAEIWTMQNPVAQYVRYTRSIIGKKPAKQLSHMRKLIETSYENTMEMLDGFFEWIDARAVQPTTEILAVYEMTVSIESSILDVISRMNQQEQKRRDLETLMSQLKTSKQVGISKMSNIHASLQLSCSEHENQ
jgi:tRNA U34 5-carboxymethylaminomethyl modifying GTPase MnmE/TrmE